MYNLGNKTFVLEKYSSSSSSSGEEHSVGYGVCLGLARRRYVTAKAGKSLVVVVSIVPRLTIID